MRNAEIKSYFENHPSVLVLFFTTDCQAFFGEDEAYLNTKNLDDRRVMAITRDEADALDAKQETLFPVEETIPSEPSFTEVEKIKVTQEILDLNPLLVKTGVKLGDEIDSHYKWENKTIPVELPVKLKEAPAETGLANKPESDSNVEDVKAAAPKKTASKKAATKK